MSAPVKPKPKASNGNKPAPVLFDITQLELGDCMDIEDITGEPAMAAFAAAEVGRLSAKALAAFVWVTRRKDDPAFTFDDARRVKLMELVGDEGPDQG